MPETSDRILASHPDIIDLHNPTADGTRKDHLVRLPIPPGNDSALRISADVRTQGVAGTPGIASCVFFNVEYKRGPIFWDNFLYPDTGTTPWRRLACEVRPRGEVSVVEMHARHNAKGRLLVRGVRVEAIEPWADDAECVVAIFGDSTDMTNNLPHDLRLSRRLELLVRDRFEDRRVDVHNFSEGGEFAQRLLESGRLDRELGTLARCDIAIIRFGLNDKGRKIDPAAFRGHLEEIRRRIVAKFPGAQLVFATTVPPEMDAYDAQTIEVAEAHGLSLLRLDLELRRISEAGDIDWHDGPRHRIGRRRLVAPQTGDAAVHGDKHPNAYGAQLIAEMYFVHLEPIVARVLEKR